jgi:glycosyltransferase involved in cell wall biosynthesis
MEKIPLTVTVLTKNNAKTLEKALQGVVLCDEIIICDGGSTDGTLEIAKRFGAKILEQDSAFLDETGKIFDYSGVRNQTLAAAKHNWIFWLDSDEYCEMELIEAMRDIIIDRGEKGSGAFWVNRKYVIHDTVIECAATYPNRQMRFFAKNSIVGMVKRIHERVKLREGVKAEFLNGFMHIPFDPNIDAIRKKWDYQIAVAAAQVSPMSLTKFIEAVAHSAKVSLLWFARLLYNSLFCSGPKMPFKFEMERHYFHIRLLRALWKVVKL